MARSANVIEQPARCGDDDIHPLAQRVDLRPRADTAEDQDGALAEVATVVVEGLADLGGELARRHEHQRTRRARSARLRVVVVQALQQRQRETGGLAGARLGGGKKVAAGEHRWDRAELDRRGCVVAEIGNGTQEVGRQAELVKGHKRNFHSASPA